MPRGLALARRLALVQHKPADAEAGALDALADALFPRFLARLQVERRDSEILDVLRAVPGPRRVLMAACRGGRIADAVKVGRRWCAPRGSIDAWLRACGPRAVAAPVEDGDDLEDLRASLARPARRRRGS